MIVGNGDLASVLQDNPKKLFFASGVSNSSEDREFQYEREKNLLKFQRKDLQIVYFSSLAVFTTDTRYFRHKLEMENLVKEFPHYAIVRIGNISWGDNPNTLINSMRYRLHNKLELNVRDEYRYIVDEEEFLYWVGLLPEWNCEMNITGKRMKVWDVVRTYCI